MPGKASLVYQYTTYTTLCDLTQSANSSSQISAPGIDGFTPNSEIAMGLPCAAANSAIHARPRL